MRCDKGKLLVLLTGLWDLKYILSSHQNPSKNKLVSENTMILVHGSCSLWIVTYGLLQTAHCKPSHAVKGFQSKKTPCSRHSIIGRFLVFVFLFNLKVHCHCVYVTGQNLKQGRQKQLAASKNRHPLGQYRLATLLGINFLYRWRSLNKVSLAAYFDNSAVYFKTF